MLFLVGPSHYPPHLLPQSPLLPLGRRQSILGAEFVARQTEVLVAQLGQQLVVVVHLHLGFLKINPK